jgi:hypothetical protein
MELESLRPFSLRLQCMPTGPRRKKFFRLARLPSELCLAARGIDGILSVRAGHQPTADRGGLTDGPGGPV